MGENIKAKTLRILGIRGIPAAHGGFETFAEKLALYLKGKGWRVIVYCQHEGNNHVEKDEWNGIERVNIYVSGGGAASTIIFDWKSIAHAAARSDLCLTLGYNTALFCSYLKINGVKNVINMDGIEWARAKWSIGARIWFWINEWAGCWLGDHLIADHPEIKRHLESRVSGKKISTIPYGADDIFRSTSCLNLPACLVKGTYFSIIARPEPENSILEVVSAFSRRVRGVKLAILGNYLDNNEYHCKVKAAASDEVLFLGAIYNKEIVNSIRYGSIAYIHGHQVGGTNPSLVEALGAGNAIVAHDNIFNRWVAGDGAVYFKSEDDVDRILESLTNDREICKALACAGTRRYLDNFTWEDILNKYENLLSRFC